MRILVISNFYPPHELGGQEIICREVVDKLIERGHQVHVLTSKFVRSTGAASNEALVSRLLHLESDPYRYSITRFFLLRRREERRNLSSFQEISSSFNPDVVFIWGTWNIPRSLLVAVEEMYPERVVYYFMGLCPSLPSQHDTYWHIPARRRSSGLFKSIMRIYATWLLERERSDGRTPAYSRAIFASRYVEDALMKAGFSFQSRQVLWHGIDLEHFLIPQDAFEEKLVRRDNLTRAIYIGRLIPDKGVHTAIEALAEIRTHPSGAVPYLTIVGSGSPEYETQLKDLVDRYSLQKQVIFLPWQARDKIPSLLREHDIFLFTSIYEEPLGQAPQEAMASGIAVIGTAVGGAAEYLIDNKNALIYEKGNPQSLASCIMHLTEDIYLRKKIIIGARETVIESFNIQTTVSKIEIYLENVLVAAG